MSRPTSREQHLYMAKIAEQTERFEDMLEAMNKVVQANPDLTIDVAYKNTIGSRRTAWRILHSIEKKQQAKGSQYLPILRGYQQKIRAQLQRYCSQIIALIDEKLLQKSSQPESRVFYLKMKGDYHRYVSQFTEGDDNKKAGDNAQTAYKEASDVAEKELSSTHPVRLGLALNYSVFFYEVRSDRTKACQLAKETFDSAIGDIDQINEEHYKDATTIMQLIRDNLTLWTAEEEQD